MAITADFVNLTVRTSTPKATLRQQQTFIASGKTRVRCSQLTTVTGAAITSGHTSTWDSQLLKIPPLPPTITNCSLIKVDYSIRVSTNTNTLISVYAKNLRIF